MEKAPLKIISPQRVKELLASYGAEPHAWPEDERSAALTLLNHSVELQALWQEARQLDDLLLSERDQQQAQQGNATISELASRIVEQLPEQKHAPAALTQPTRHPAYKSWSLAAAAAILLLAATFVVQLRSPLPSPQQPAVAATEYEQWLWQDITGEDINSDENATENGELTFLALVDLE